MNLEVRLGKIRLASPLIGASGIFGYGPEYGELMDFSRFGAVVTKTLTLEPKEGNPPPRVVDVGCGILNSIGLENIGCDSFIHEKLPAIDLPCSLFVSIGGQTIDGYRRTAGLLDRASGVTALEVNISCPNVSKGGIAFGSDAESAHRVLDGVRAETGLPLIAKLPPLVSGLERVCQAVCDAGADALTLANTYPAIAIDIDREAPVLGGVTGGLSGRAIKPVSLLLVWKMAKIVEVPIIASGGIESASDAIEYILAGATACEIGSIVLGDPGAPSKVVDGIGEYMKSKGYDTLEHFRGNATR